MTQSAQVSLLILLAAAITGCGQGPALPPAPSGVPSSGQQFAPRLPDDQVEGTIFEYKGRPEDSDPGSVPTLIGRFRVEGSAVFDTAPRITLPGRDEIESKVEAFKRGGPVELRPPEMPQQKRLGDIRSISGGRKRIDFNDPELLHGIMIIWQKKDTPDVWLGTYSKKEGRKTVEK